MTKPTTIEKKKVLLDLSVLKHPYCGLGQVALNYIRTINLIDTDSLPFRFVLLVPRNYYGCCGDKVDYVPRKRYYKLLPFLYPKVQVWHAIHQLSSFRPYSRQTKYLLTVHDLNFMYEKSDKVARQYKSRVQKRIDRADRICCISNFTKSELYRYMNVPKDTPVSVIYNGVEFADANAAECCPRLIDPAQPFFFSIGEMKEKKNFMSIVKMMRYMPDRQLYLAGNDRTDYANLIRKYISQNGINNVRLLGFVSDEERVWLYRHCDAFLFPSLFEGFGLPVIEAMSHGKPVFSSMQTSLSEIAGEYAFAFRSFEPEQMATTVRCNLPLFSEQRRLSEIEYAHTFSYTKHFNQYIEIYKSLCN